MITITERAASEVKRIVAEQKLPGTTALRVGVKGGGCSGFSYTLGFDDQMAETDQVYEIGGVRISNRVLLAPLAGIGNWFVRLQARRHGAGLAVSEMVSSFGLHKEYHQPSDEIRMIDFAHMTDSIRSMLEPVRWLANSGFKPDWLPGRKP